MNEMLRHWTGRILYTIGVQTVAEKCGAYWFLDIVASYQIHDHVRNEPFQVWRLDRQTGRRFVVTMTDGNTKSPLVRQEIEYSDFPDDTLELWCSDGVLLTPDEY
jgi:hypothetical protein